MTDVSDAGGGSVHTGGRRFLHPLLLTVLQRLGLGVVTLFMVSILIFTSIEALPGDFAEAMLGRSATRETVIAYRHQLGLDQPAVERYFSWIGGAVHGDFGMSLASRPQAVRTVTDIIGPRLYNTFFLAVMTASFAVPLALGLGMLTALYQNSFFDRAINALTLTTISVPEFFIAYILCYLVISKDNFSSSDFANSLPVWLADLGTWLTAAIPRLPTLAVVDASAPFFARVWDLLLPALTLTLVIVAHMMRMTRAVLVGLLASPYIEMAKLKGLSRARAVFHHALPNAWAPIATVVALNLAYLIVGVVVVEV